MALETGNGQPFDVAVIGGGPGGSSTATALATIAVGAYPQPYITSAANAFHSANGAEGVHAAALEP